jgi:hypothetical protein
MTGSAKALRVPAMATGFQSTSLMRSPPELQSVAARRSRRTPDLRSEGMAIRCGFFWAS